MQKIFFRKDGVKMSRIKEAREQAGLTRKFLAEWLEMPYRTLENYEQGKTPTPKYIENLIVAEIERIPQKKKITITRN